MGRRFSTNFEVRFDPERILRLDFGRMLIKRTGFQLQVTCDWQILLFGRSNLIGEIIWRLGFRGSVLGG